MAKKKKAYRGNRAVGAQLGKSRAGRALLRADRPKKKTIAATAAVGAAAGAYFVGKPFVKGGRFSTRDALGGAVLGAGAIGLQHVVNKRDPRIKAMQEGAATNTKTGIRGGNTPTKAGSRSAVKQGNRAQSKPYYTRKVNNKTQRVKNTRRKKR